MLKIKNMKRDDKKGQSEIIGYILLIVVAVVMSFIVYAYLKSYVPKDKVECPSDLSLIVRSYENNCDAGNLSLELENKGLFNVSGYSLRGSTDENRDIANIVLASNTRLSYDLLPQPLGPGQIIKVRNIYQGKINLQTDKLAFIEIIPYIKDKNKNVVCTDAKIKEKITCTEVCWNYVNNVAKDDDGDGKANCADLFCEGKSCDVTHPSNVCNHGACIDASTTGITQTVCTPTPPSYRCNGNNYETCNSQGTAWTSVNCAASGQICDVSQGGCVASGGT